MHPPMTDEVLSLANALNANSYALGTNNEALSHRQRIRAATRLVRDSESLLTAMVAQARRDGTSWAQVGRGLGTTRQAAHERFRHLDDVDEPDPRRVMAHTTSPTPEPPAAKSSRSKPRTEAKRQGG